MVTSSSAIQQWVSIISILIAVVTVAGSAVKYFLDENIRREQLLISQNKESEQRRIEATRPFLQRQLELYTEATRTAATIAVSDDPEAVKSAKARFLQLFWGELALVEDGKVEAAMMAFKLALDDNAARANLQQCSLRLAVACRDSLAKSWNTSVWQSHYSRAPDCPGRGSAQAAGPVGD